MECLARIGDRLDRKRHPHLWASSQANLGNAFLQRIVGDPRENIEQAIGRYTGALEIFNPRGYPDLYCRCAANLAHAYEIRIVGDREENMEDAIALGFLALRIYDAVPPNTEWARLHNNLGGMYRSRIAGDRAKNVESAIGHYRAALRVWKRARFADDWARVQHNLGVAYRKRARDDPGANLKRARVHLHGALSVRTRERFPTDWLRSQQSLALTETQGGNWPQVERIAREVMRFLGDAIAGLGNWYEMRRLIGAASATKNLGVLAIAEQGNLADAFAFLIQGYKGGGSCIRRCSGPGRRRARSPRAMPSQRCRPRGRP
jgi:tetratricopeptide (TPR) repeat protein